MSIITPAADLDQWHLQRWSKFTASENYKLLPSVPGSTFSPGGITYINEKVLQMTTNMWSRPELDEVESLLHGKVHEYPAYQALVRATDYTGLIYLGEESPLFLEYEALQGESGGSPDSISLTSDAKVDIVAEIKCPKNPMYHFKRMFWKDQWDVKEKYIQAYTQIQNLLMITGSELGLFVSYDDRQRIVNKKIKIIEVKPDRKFQDNLDIRLRMAVKEKYRRYEEFMNS
jgi:hypothetical protein